MNHKQLISILNLLSGIKGWASSIEAEKMPDYLQRDLLAEIDAT